MLGYKLDRISNDLPFYNLHFEKEVHKRDGTTEIGYGDKVYCIRKEDAHTLIAHKKTQDDFGDKNVSLKEYLTEFYKNYANCRT